MSKFRKLDTGAIIGQPNEVPTKIYMLISGVMRAYLGSETGKEHNKNFFMPFSFVGAFTGLIEKKPSKIYVPSEQAGMKKISNSQHSK